MENIPEKWRICLKSGAHTHLSKILDRQNEKGDFGVCFLVEKQFQHPVDVSLLYHSTNDVRDVIISVTTFIVSMTVYYTPYGGSIQHNLCFFCRY